MAPIRKRGFRGATDYRERRERCVLGSGSSDKKNSWSYGEEAWLRGAELGLAECQCLYLENKTKYRAGDTSTDNDKYLSSQPLRNKFPRKSIIQRTKDRFTQSTGIFSSSFSSWDLFFFFCWSFFVFNRAQRASETCSIRAWNLFLGSRKTGGSRSAQLPH